MVTLVVIWIFSGVSEMQNGVFLKFHVIHLYTSSSGPHFCLHCFDMHDDLI